ncbi:MAG: M48 family peptidase [Calditrichaeota bacterium]|nr:MAG: M48 family peptidase [Calditrichota bacterium]
MFVSDKFACPTTKIEKYLIESQLNETNQNIKYIFLHLQPNHNKDFYGLLDKVLPKWKFYKNRLALV